MLGFLLGLQANIIVSDPEESYTEFSSHLQWWIGAPEKGQKELSNFPLAITAMEMGRAILF